MPYKKVNFLPHRAIYGVSFVRSKAYQLLIFCCCQNSVVCDIIMYWTALYNDTILYCVEMCVALCSKAVGQWFLKGAQLIYFSVEILNIPVSIHPIITIITYSSRTEVSATVRNVPCRGHRHAQVAQKFRLHISGVDRLFQLADSSGLPTTPHIYVVIIKTTILINTIITIITCKS